MKNLKFQLLAATMVAGLSATGANAQFAFPAPGPNDSDSALHAVGATSIQTILVQSLNCIGVNNQLGNNSGQLSNVPAGLYQPSTPSAANPTFNCATQDIQPAFSAKYVGTGSGTGRSFWRNFTNQLPGTTPSNQNPFGTWTHVQFAFSDTPASASDISAYNTGAAAQGAGAAIQFPLYVLPVALAYDPRYGVKTTGSGPVDLKFNVKSTFVTKDRFGNPTGGLRLQKTDYCKIFNGEITNWNDAALKTRNGGQSLADVNDAATRWGTEGVPIRLVGRLDKSGTTDIFTRHLAATCASFVATNKYQRNAEALPYFKDASSPDMSTFRTDTPYKPTSTDTFSNTSNDAAHMSISGAFFNRTTSTIDTSKGTEAAGKFLVADGSGGVNAAIKFAPDVTSTVDSTVKLNGKFGYIGADFITPAPNATLFAAALQVGTGASFAAPTAANGTAAVGTILPPETTAASGAYNTSDARVSTNSGTGVKRSNPLDWTDVLYSNSAATLASPTKGYAITGTTQFLGYSCYATISNRVNVIEFLSLNFGKVTKTSANTPISANTFKGVGNTALGFLAQAGIAPLPAAWQNAINETFLKKSTQVSPVGGAKLSDLNLWLQDKLPVKATDIDGINAGTNKELLANPTCTAGTGA